MLKKTQIIFSLAIFITLILFGLYLLNSLKRKNTNNENKTVYIKNTDNKKFQLFKNGRSFFIQGASGNGSYIKELAEQQANTIRFYDTINIIKKLDEAEKYGLSVIVDIPLPKYTEKYNQYADDRTNNLLKKDIRGFVKKIKNHPALLFWILGNEIDYPAVFFKNSFIDTFNNLIDIIHEEDPNHPVSTTVAGIYKRPIISIYYHSPKLDFISFNVFGQLDILSSQLDKISFLTGARPYFVSEWGMNGPWESEVTKWGAPIEPTSSKKIEQLYDRYRFITNNIDSGCLGSLVFYWGKKQERTHTWYSLFENDSLKSNIVQSLGRIWNASEPYHITSNLEYMLVDKKGSKESLVFLPNEKKVAELKFHTLIKDSVKIRWEIYPEVWQYEISENQKKSKKITGLFKTFKKNQATFVTPSTEGPYRIFTHVIYKNGSFETTNVPFYVLQRPSH